MTPFEKYLVMFFVPKIYSKDIFAKDSGFVDAYTKDDDHPSYENSIFLMYKYKENPTEASIKAHKTISLHISTKRSYVKYISNIPYIIYEIYVPIKYLNMFKYSAPVCGKREYIIDYWGLDDEFTKWSLYNNLAKVERTSVPLGDELPERNANLRIKKGLTEK